MASNKKSGNKAKDKSFKVIEVAPEDLKAKGPPRSMAWGVQQDRWPGSAAPARDGSSVEQSRTVIQSGDPDGPVFMITTTTVVQMLPAGTDLAEIPARGKSAWQANDRWPGSAAPTGSRAESAWGAADIWPGSAAKADNKSTPKRTKR